MALDTTLIGRTGVEAVAALMNYTLNTNIDPAWITCTGAGSPFQAPITVDVQSVTTPDASGNAPPYTGGQLITYNRVGFQAAFTGLGLQVNLVPPFTYAQLVAAIRNQYGIVLEQGDIQNQLSAVAQLDGSNNVSLNPGGGSLRFFIDYSPFALKVNINTSVLTDLQKLIATANQADMAALNAANTPVGHGYPAVPLSPDSVP